MSFQQLSPSAQYQTGGPVGQSFSTANPSAAQVCPSCNQQTVFARQSNSPKNPGRQYWACGPCYTELGREAPFLGWVDQGAPKKPFNTTNDRMRVLENKVDSIIAALQQAGVMNDGSPAHINSLAQS